MKKSLFILVACMFFMSNAWAQNSAVEAAQEYKETKVEQFLKTNHFTKIEQIYTIKQDNFVMEPLVITNLLTGEKIAGVLTSYDDTGASLGYYDFDEIDDVLKVLDQILALSKEKLTYKKTYVSWTSKSGVQIYYDAAKKETFFRKKWHYTNQYGVRTVYYQSTDDTNIGAVDKIRKDLQHAKTLLEGIVAGK